MSGAPGMLQELNRAQNYAEEGCEARGAGHPAGSQTPWEEAPVGRTVHPTGLAHPIGWEIPIDFDITI